MRAPEVIQHYSDGRTGPKLLDVEPERWPVAVGRRGAGTPTRCGRSPLRAAAPP